MATATNKKYSYLIGYLFKTVDKNDTILASTLVNKIKRNYKLNINYKNQINKVDYLGIGLLLSCVRKNNNDILKQLLTLPAFDLNTTNIYGETALHIACVNNNKDSLKMLLDKCSNVLVNSKDNKGDTPLICAIKFGHREVLRILLDDQRVNLIPGVECNLGSVEQDKYLITACGELIQNEKRKRNMSSIDKIPKSILGSILEMLDDKSKNSAVGASISMSLASHLIIKEHGEYGTHVEDTQTITDEQQTQTQPQLYLSPSPQEQSTNSQPEYYTQEYCPHEQSTNSHQEYYTSKLESLKRVIHLDEDKKYEFEQTDESRYEHIDNEQEQMDQSIYEENIDNGLNTF